MLKKLYPHKILWLASYPKSGNTWFRAFLSALMNNGKVVINKLDTDGVFSSRDTFDFVTDVDSIDLYDEEAKAMVADVYRYLAETNDTLKIIKTHDAFVSDKDGVDIFPADVTHCAFYFIRNPLDVVGSFANHMRLGIEESVAIMCDKTATLATQKNNLNKNKQFRVIMGDWSTNVLSWTSGLPFPVHVIRYEDMLSNPFKTFSKAVCLAKFNFSPEEIQKAIDASSFDQLKKQETQFGFVEKLAKDVQFFRSGTMGNWEKELTPAQIDKIRQTHSEVMSQYGYF